MSCMLDIHVYVTLTKGWLMRDTRSGDSSDAIPEPRVYCKIGYLGLEVTKMMDSLIQMPKRP